MTTKVLGKISLTLTLNESNALGKHSEDGVVKGSAALRQVQEKMCCTQTGNKIKNPSSSLLKL
jgi:hypothetical protein